MRRRPPRSTLFPYTPLSRSRLSGLGFAGVDVTVDARQGPIVMEVNRRPGLEIQNANAAGLLRRDRKSTRLNSSHDQISYAVFCLQKKKDGSRRDQQS